MSEIINPKSEETKKEFLKVSLQYFYIFIQQPQKNLTIKSNQK